jgi:hypothetical protein
MDHLNRDGAPEHRLPTGLQEVQLKPLWLTREEALQLLEVSVTASADLTQVEESAVPKLGDLCRAFLRDDRTS